MFQKHAIHDLVADSVIGIDGATVELGVEESVEEEEGAQMGIEVPEVVEVRSHANQELIWERHEGWFAPCCPDRIHPGNKMKSVELTSLVGTREYFT
jgi:hypothetical protein